MKMTKNEVKRVIDANFNRLCEGLRAVEDYCRFISENDKAFKKIKDIRHLIFKNYKTCVFYRDSVRDMGNNYTTLKELEKKPSDLITANCFRVKESLRALEEYYKIIDLKKSGLFKNVRYDFYELEKNIACFKKNIAEKGTLYAVTEEGGSLLYKKAESVLAGGADILQYRAKKLSFKKCFMKRRV